MALSKDSGLWARLLITGALFVLSAWWLWVVWQKLSVQPVLSEDGKVIFDEYARAKDVLLVVVPLLTLALGYWFGAQGTAKAEEKAQKEEKKAEETNAQLKEALGLLPADLYQQAVAEKPKAFGVGR